MVKQTSLTLRNHSRARQAAKRVGILIETPHPHLPVTEQEETDVM